MSLPEDLTPTQQLIMEVLAARYRLGETSWPFPVTLTRSLDALAAAGLVTHQSDVMPGHRRTWLTGPGQSAVLPAGWRSAYERAVEDLTHPTETHVEWASVFRDPPGPADDDPGWVARPREEAARRCRSVNGHEVYPAHRTVTYGPWVEVEPS